LVWEVFVYRYERIELRGCKSQELAILDAKPAHLDDSPNGVARKMMPEPGRDGFVKQ